MRISLEKQRKTLKNQIKISGQQQILILSFVREFFKHFRDLNSVQSSNGTRSRRCFRDKPSPKSTSTKRNELFFHDHQHILQPAPSVACVSATTSACKLSRSLWHLRSGYRCFQSQYLCSRGFIFSVNDIEHTWIAFRTL